MEGYLAEHPERATELGDHRFDGQLSDYSAATRTRQLARAKQFREELKKFDDFSQLTGPNRVDVRILRENVDSEIFQLEEMKEPDWNPLVYTRSLADSLYLIVARDFDTPENRIPNLRKRMEAIPLVIAEAKKNLQHPPRVHTETAIEQTEGAIKLVREGLSTASRSRAANEEGPRADPGKNREGAGGLQEMAEKRSAKTFRRQFSHRRGEVSQEICISRSPRTCRWKKS